MGDQDTGAAKAQGQTGGPATGAGGEGQVEHEGAPISEDEHGWAPDSGEASDPNRQAGDRAFESRDQSPESTSERTET
jgi:hypothetical protein